MHARIVCLTINTRDIIQAQLAGKHNYGPSYATPANAKHLYDIYTLLDQRRSRCSQYTNVLCFLGRLNDWNCK